MKIRQLISIPVMVSLALFLGCEKKVNPVEESDTPAKTNMVDTTIDASKQDVKVAIPGKISLTIPKGIAAAGTKLTITEVSTQTAPVDSNLTFHTIYDVTLSSGTTFSTALDIAITYDPQKVPSGKFPRKIGVAYYHETQKKWNVYQDAVIDSVQHVIRFKTSHLTKLGLFGWRNIEGYTDFFGTSHFYIYWKSGEPMSNTEYISPYRSVHVGTDPHYIQDIAGYLEQAYTQYKNLGLTLPTSKIDVYVKDLGSVDGNTSFFGYLQINKKLKEEVFQRTSVKYQADILLPQVCAHELLHFVQDYYYMQMFVGKYITTWWLEALATQADRMVWNDKQVYEADIYADNAFYSSDPRDLLSLSWDDCNKDPNWYCAGGFLAYLAAHRPGSHVNIADILIEGGKETTLSYMRTVIDSYLKAKGISSGIGKEYADYIRWMVEQKGSIQIPQKPPLQSSSEPHIVGAFLSDVSLTANLQSTIPFLSTRFVKIRNLSTILTTVAIKAEQLPVDVTALLYRCTSKSRSFIKTITQGETISSDGVATSEWLEIICVNTSKDNNNSIKFQTNLQWNARWKFLSRKVIPMTDESGDPTLSSYKFIRTDGGTSFKTRIEWSYQPRYFEGTHTWQEPPQLIVPETNITITLTSAAAKNYEFYLQSVKNMNVITKIVIDRVGYSPYSTTVAAGYAPSEPSEWIATKSKTVTFKLPQPVSPGEKITIIFEVSEEGIIGTFGGSVLPYNLTEIRYEYQAL